ncbi:MAG: SUMF1/EgtB/PvdO family nonheme iron enzyme [Opitutales bacterium]|nr:SUMF1/EgtB/PvdO family nonheme iron enzyme [Opitutales bacterium]
MALFHKYGTRSSEIRRAKKEFFLKLKLSLLAVSLILLFFLLAQFGPPSCSGDQFEFSEPTTVLDDSASIALSQTLNELQAELESLEPESAEATTLLEETLNIRRELDRYPASRDTAETQRLQRLLSTWHSQPLKDELELRVGEAQQAAAGEDWVSAAEAYAAAIGIQQQLLRDHRESPHASLSRLQMLQREYASVAAESDGSYAPTEASPASRQQRAEEAVRSQAKTLQQALRAGDRDAITLSIAKLSRSIESHNQRFPEEGTIDPNLTAQVAFLFPFRAEVTLLQELVQRRLRPIPGEDSWQLLEVEVWQDLYQRMVGNNPSLNRNPRYPVDSVSHEEALQFCQRIAWLLGREVDLPSPQDLRAALGDQVSLPVVDRLAVHALSHQREPAVVASKTANEHGFYDLLGNIAEWTRSPDGEFAEVWGGSARDSAALLATVPSETRRISERNRTTGFRIKVSNRTHHD